MHRKDSELPPGCQVRLAVPASSNPFFTHFDQRKRWRRPKGRRTDAQNAVVPLQALRCPPRSPNQASSRPDIFRPLARRWKTRCTSRSEQALRRVPP
jgi:hypothetical protein